MVFIIDINTCMLSDPRNSSRACRGFSLFEALAVLGIVGILSWVVVASHSRAAHAVAVAKLDSDVATVNQAIKVYIASGGSLSGITAPQAVLDKMKTCLLEEDAEKSAGFSGAMIDPRLAVREATATEEQSAVRRAVWTPSLMRFEIRTSGPGVAEFVLESTAGTTAFGSETRSASVLDYETHNGWIWRYADSPEQPRATPSVVALSSASPSGNPVDPSEGTGHTQLVPPAFSEPPGSYPQSRFNLTVALLNPNRLADTWIMYSRNGAAYVRYEEPLTVTADTAIAAFVTGDGTRYFTSGRMDGQFCAKPPIILASPLITTSHPQFTWLTAETVEASLTNPNDPAVSSMEYRIDSGPWLPYSGPILLAIRDHQNGVAITARTLARSVDYRMSAETSASVQAPFAVEALLAPVIATSAPNFVAGSFDSVTVTLTNPNPGAAECVVEYSLDGAGWQTYCTPFVVTRKDYPLGVAIEARARATSKTYTDSHAARARVGLTPVNLLPPVVTPSAPNLVAESVETITVTLSNPNPAGDESILEYSLTGIAGGWRTYSSAIRLTRKDFPQGITFSARAKSTSPAYTTSPDAVIRIGLTPVVLKAPRVTPSALNFVPGSVETVSVTLTNLNTAAAGSVLEYRINGGAWRPYAGAISLKLPKSLAPQLVEGRAKSTQLAYTDSATTSASIGFVRGTLQPPTITLSNTKFDANTRSIKVSLSDPNPTGLASLRYSVVATGQSHPQLTAFNAYSGTLTASAKDYPSGFTIQAFAKAVDSTRWNDSGPANDAAGANFFGIPVTGKRIVFVLDASSSMNAGLSGATQTRFQVAVSELGKAIAGLSSSLEFGIAFFDAGERWVSNQFQLQKASSSNRSAAITATNAVTTGLGTNYDVALGFPFRFSATPDQVIFLTDGLPNHPTSWYDELAALVKGGVKVDCVGIECTPGAKGNLKNISSSTGGTVIYLDGATGTVANAISSAQKTTSALNSGQDIPGLDQTYSASLTD